MSGSFTWDAIVRIETIKAYEKALVLTVYHTLEGQTAACVHLSGQQGTPSSASSNPFATRLSITCHQAICASFTGMCAPARSPMTRTRNGAPLTWLFRGLISCTNISRCRRINKAPGRARTGCQAIQQSGCGHSGSKYPSIRFVITLYSRRAKPCHREAWPHSGRGTFIDKRCR